MRAAALYLIAIFAPAAAGAAPATASVVLRGKMPIEVRQTLAEACNSAGGKLELPSDYEIRCLNRLTGIRAAAAGMFLPHNLEDGPYEVLTFTVAPIRDGTLLQAEGSWEGVVNGRRVTEPFTSKAEIARIKRQLDAMAAGR